MKKLRKQHAEEIREYKARILDLTYMIKYYERIIRNWSFANISSYLQFIFIPNLNFIICWCNNNVWFIIFWFIIAKHINRLNNLNLELYNPKNENYKNSICESKYQVIFFKGFIINIHVNFQIILLDLLEPMRPSFSLFYCSVSKYYWNLIIFWYILECNHKFKIK